MAYKNKVSNSVRFSPNPWIPNKKQFFTPSKQTLTFSEEGDKISVNMCRLSLLFPTIKINYILKILKLHHFNITETIDTLLFIKTVQQRAWRERYFTQQKYLRKFTCARCVPFKRRTVLEHILEEDIVKDDRVILPNITFGNDTTSVFYEHELNFSLPSAHTRNELNIESSQRFEEPVTNEEILHVIDSDILGSSNSHIKLRVRRKKSGMYSSQLV